MVPQTFIYNSRFQYSVKKNMLASSAQYTLLTISKLETSMYGFNIVVLSSWKCFIAVHYYVTIGSRHPLEQVLSQFIKPALQATFTSSNCATISAASLQQWCNVNYWNRSISGGEEQSTPTVVGQKRHFSEIGGSGTCNDKMSNDDIPVPGLEHGSGSEPRTGMEPGLTAGPNTVPRLGHGLMCEPALTPGATSVSTVYSYVSTH